MIAIATIIASLHPGHLHIEHMFFGNIEAVNQQDIISLIISGIALLGFIAANFHKLVMIVISKDIAKAKGINVSNYELIFLVLIALVVFSAIKATGALLASSMLIIPALIARIYARSPSAMVILAIIFSVTVNVCGYLLYSQVDKLLSPIIVAVGVLVFCICRVVSYFRG